MNSTDPRIFVARPVWEMSIKRRVSVIMPCFNHSRFISDSVSGVLDQSHENLELIVVDDRSTDNSWDIITRLADGDSRIKPIRHERNQGVSKSRNDGLRAAEGDFIAFCDADDIWDREKLKSQLAELESHPDYDVAYCDARIVDERGTPTGNCFSDLFPPPKSASGRLFYELIKTNFINTQTVVMRRDCLKETGCFDEDLQVVEDWWYWIQLARQHRFLYSPRLLAKYRMHGGSTSVVHKRSYSISRYKVFRRILAGYSDLPRSVRADIFFRMGVDLCEIGKRRAGRRLLWKAVRLSLTDPRASLSLCRAVRRLVLQALGPERGRLHGPRVGHGDSREGMIGTATK
jgi:glycosyltransferase involved in cell wall biosynthesis